MSGSVQTVPAVAVCTALQEVHKWNWTGVNCVCVCGGELIYVLVYLVVRHGYENIKVRYHHILWQFCTIYCSTVYFHTDVSL